MKFTERLRATLGPRGAQPVWRRHASRRFARTERHLGQTGTRGETASERLPASEVAAEEALRVRLAEDPNDHAAFDQLVVLVAKRAAQDAQQHEGIQHSEADPGLTGAIQLNLAAVRQDAIWAVAEELAGHSKAWYPLVVLASQSVHDDREAALRRLGTAADRDPSGMALSEGLAMLRREQLPAEALSLGTGYWRPKEHPLEVGEHMVRAALEADRAADARRHLEAIGYSADPAAAKLQEQLKPLVDKAS